MDSRIGLDYIVENQEYTSKLASGKGLILVTQLLYKLCIPLPYCNESWYVIMHIIALVYLSNTGILIFPKFSLTENMCLIKRKKVKIKSKKIK